MTSSASTVIDDAIRPVENFLFRLGASAAAGPFRAAIRVNPVVAPFSSPAATAAHLGEVNLRSWFVGLDWRAALAVTRAAGAWYRWCVDEGVPVSVESAVANCSLAAGRDGFWPVGQEN